MASRKLKEGWWTSNTLVRKQADEAPELHTPLPFLRKERGLWGGSHEPGGQSLTFTGWSCKPQISRRSGNLTEFVGPDFEIAWDLWLRLPSILLPIWTGISLTGILCLSHHYILGVKYKKKKTQLQMERNFTLGPIRPTPDLDDEIWGLWAADIKMRV